MLYRSFLIQTA